MNGDLLTDLARVLGDAWSDAVTVPAPSRVHPSLTTADAYTVQDLIIEERLRTGRRRAGWKMGLTTAPPPAVPIVGTLLDDMIVPSGSTLRLSTMVAPLVEAEILIRIGETLDRPQTITDLERGPHEIGPGIEVIDYRTTDAAGIVDWIADNSTVAYAIVGTFVPLLDVTPALIEASLTCDGRHLATGRGDQVMGNPLAAVAWLSRDLVERGHRLEAGDVILTGSLTGSHAVPTVRRAGFIADFGALGTVDVRFVP